MLQHLGPVLIPSWRFFDRIGPRISIEYTWLRSPTDKNQAAAWQLFDPRNPQPNFFESLSTLFYNPMGNEYLYLLSCGEKIVSQDSEPAVAIIFQRLPVFSPNPLTLPYFVFRILTDNQVSYVSEPKKLSDLASTSGSRL